MYSFPHLKIEKNKKLFGVNQKVSPGLSNHNFLFSRSQFNPSRFRSVQNKSQQPTIYFSQ